MTSLRIGLLALAAAVASPTSALAARVEVVVDSSRTVAFEGDGGRNDISLSATLGAGRSVVVTVRDSAQTLAAGPGCRRVDRHRARCVVPARPASPESRARPDAEALVRALGGNDQITVSGGPWSGAALEGGRGDDRLTGPDPPQTPPLVLDYFDLRGGRGDDVLRGGDGADELTGGGGRDVLRGRGGDDLLEDDDARRGDIGPDVLDGGSGSDTVSYGREDVAFGRRKRVKIDLADRRRDGQRGERDRIKRVENLTGGRGRDILKGTGGPNEIAGESGFEDGGKGDRIHARGGADTITAGARDLVHAGRGRDRIFLDGNARVLCGPGRDRVFQSLDFEAGPTLGPRLKSTCERLITDDGDPDSENPAVALDPRPVGRTSESLTFRLPCGFGACSEARLRLIRQRRPRRTLAVQEFTAPAGSTAEVTLRLPDGVAAAARRRPVVLAFSLTPADISWRMALKLPRG